MGDNNIENLFIVKEGSAKANIEEQAKRVLPFGRITESGAVVIDNRSLTKVDQLKLCLVIRFIGNFFKDDIERQVRPIELTETLGQRYEAIGSTLSKLASEGFAKKDGHGKYSAFPYKIDGFLDYLEKISTPILSIPKPKGSRKKTVRKSKGNTLTGIGKHIQQLIDDGFFQTPRFISEVVQELKKENVYRDQKVIDKTIRDSFVSMRRTLQRIPNEDGGRSKWKYMIRK